MTNQDPSLVNSGEQAYTAEHFVEQLQTLNPNEQSDFYNDWLDKTVPGRLTAKTREASAAAASGNSDLEQILVLEAYAELEEARDYAQREATNELTSQELATKEALASIFPDKWPFVTAK